MFMGTERNGAPIEPGPYCEGPSLDRQGEFSFAPKFEPLGEEPMLGFARPDSAAQAEQMDAQPTTNALT
jgi:Mn-containing catalase